MPQNRLNSKTCLKETPKEDQKLVFKTDYCLMQVKSIADSAILLTFIRLQFVIKIFVLSIFEQPLKTGFTVIQLQCLRMHLLQINYDFLESGVCSQSF